jgi:AmpD protein
MQTKAGTDSPWCNGWFHPAKALPSPNFGPRPENSRISLIVVHSISLPPGQYGGNQVQQLFLNQLNWDEHPYFQQMRGLEVSAHFYIQRDGTLWQFVSVHDRAWHAGASVWRDRPNCNDYSIGIELEGLEGDIFEPAQYAQLATVCLALTQQVPIEAIVGHEHVAPGRKADPGIGFDWQKLTQSLGQPFHKLISQG